MNAPQIKFEDGAAYEEFMGKWSYAAGTDFLRWLDPGRGLRWVDVGCGNGASTEMLLALCTPSSVHAIDPSEAQLKFATERTRSPLVEFRQGDAMELPYADRMFDAAVMALVIFFVPEPQKGVSEMVRVVAPGGSVSAYAWDILGGGFPYAVLQQEIEALGFASVWPPSVEASRMDRLRELWSAAGLVKVETSIIEVERSFPSFDGFWEIAVTAPTALKRLGEMTPVQASALKARVQARMAGSSGQTLRVTARANAIKGFVAD